MPAQIDAEIAAILARVARVDLGLLSAGTALSDLGIDSIVMVEAIFSIEEAYDISIPYADDPGPMTFGALVEIVTGLVKARP
jgi:acyl carrier protein